MNLKRLVVFLRGLEAHNHKPWFESHHGEYEALRSEFEDLVEQVILMMGRFEPGVRGLGPRECVYRIYRDVRFSKDKRPYKTTFGAAINPDGRRGTSPGYHMHVDSKRKLMVAAGLYMPDAKQLGKIRRSIVNRPGKLRAIVSAPSFRRRFGGLYDGDKLKSFPRGFPCDHPDLELLRLKRFVAWVEKPVSRLGGARAVRFIGESSRALQPLVGYLREATGA